MKSWIFLRRIILPVVGLLLVGGGVLTGCKGDAKFSQKEEEQFKQGPPKEMPEQARKMFQDAMKAGAGPSNGSNANAGAPSGR